MERHEALSIVHEILDDLKESAEVTSISLDNCAQIERVPKGFYVIKMKCQLDLESEKCLQLILNKHGLIMKKEQGLVTIYRHPP